MRTKAEQKDNEETLLRFLDVLKSSVEVGNKTLALKNIAYIESYLINHIFDRVQ